MSFLPNNNGQRFPNEKQYRALSPNNSSSTSLLSSRRESESTSELGHPYQAGSRSPGGFSNHHLRGNRFSQSAVSVSTVHSISDKYSLSPDPQNWGTLLNQREPDDALHEPDRLVNKNGGIFSSRGLQNLGCLAFLMIALITLFAGYPLISFFTRHPLSTLGGFNFGGINATGQVPAMSGNWGLIDLETPQELHTIRSYHDPSQQLQLVFSDEFNTDGRSFYPGDDPYWEAVDLHYWSTGNLEWYDPAAITTANGSLKVTLSKKKTHDLNYQGGMMTTWNKFCFTGGLLQAAVTLPGANNVMGLWPAVWSMGNLGRAGYGASLDGMWPYTYDNCDVGTVHNQTVNGKPLTATTHGDNFNGDALSYLPGQKLSRCTCPGESHPGPIHGETGEYVGRAAPEIDVFEALVAQVGDDLIGQVSQSAQWAPYNQHYEWFNTSDNLIIYDTDVTQQNLYIGAAYQQATSAISTTNSGCYELENGCFSVYAFEYKPGYNDGYITWVNDNKLAWTINGGGLAADNRVEIGARQIPVEPMYLIVNLGMSPGFGKIDLEHLTFPTTMSIDYIRVYQPVGSVNIGCDPPNYPTAAYINEYIEAYTNPNLTTWVDDFQQPFPKNKFLGEC